MTTLSTGKVAVAWVGVSPARLNRTVLVGTRGVPVLGVARKVFVAAFSKATALRDLRQMSLDAEQSLGSSRTSFLPAAACPAWLPARSSDRPEARAVAVQRCP